MSCLGEFQFTTFVLILTARMSKLVNEIRQGGLHLFKTYKQILDVAGILNSAFNVPLLISFFTSFFSVIIILHDIITRPIGVLWSFIRFMLVSKSILKLWILIYICDSAHSAVSNLIAARGKLKVCNCSVDFPSRGRQHA